MTSWTNMNQFQFGQVTKIMSLWPQVSSGQSVFQDTVKIIQYDSGVYKSKVCYAAVLRMANHSDWLSNLTKWSDGVQVDGDKGGPFKHLLKRSLVKSAEATIFVKI